MAPRETKYVIEWAWTQPWLDKDHLAFLIYRATTKGYRDKRSVPMIVTIHKEDMLKHTIAPLCFASLMDEGTARQPENCKYHRYVYRRINSEQWYEFTRTYPIARDYLIDQIGEPK